MGPPLYFVRTKTAVFICPGHYESDEDRHAAALWLSSKFKLPVREFAGGLHINYGEDFSLSIFCN